MSDPVWETMDGIGKLYVQKGFPQNFAFAPGDDKDLRNFDALGGSGMIRRLNHTMWGLTDAGMQRILDQVPESAEASALYEDLKRQHTPLRLLSGKDSPFGPADESERPVYNELRARGRLRHQSAVLFVFSEEAVRKMKGA